MEADIIHRKKTARLAGALFIFLCVPLSIWGQSYVSGKIFVSQDPVATANNLLSNEFPFRTRVVSHLASNITFAFMVLLLCRLFKALDKNLARLMVAPVLSQVAIFLGSKSTSLISNVLTSAQRMPQP